MSQNESVITDRIGVAKLFGCSPETIKNWDKLGAPSLKIGRLRRYVVADVLAWAREHFAQGGQQKTAPTGNG